MFKLKDFHNISSLHDWRIKHNSRDCFAILKIIWISVYNFIQTFPTFAYAKV